MKRHTLRTLAAAALLAGFGLALRAYLLGGAPDRPKNLILITLDTTRADALGAYGSSQAVTPWMNAMAVRGNLWEQAYSHAPITLPSHSSLLTGLIPPEHGVRNNIAYRLPESATTLAELFQKRGYATGAFVSSMILDGRFGLDQGFDLYEDQIVHYTERTAKAIVTRRAEVTLDASMDWLGKHQQQHPDQQFFSWIHLYDAHYPYDPPLPFKHAHADQPYQGEIAYVDRQLGRLMRFLREQGLDRDTLVVITADHGEAFGEHGEATHGFFSYRATTHVPMIFSQPLFGPAGARFKHPVQSIDLMPTLAQLFDLEKISGRGRLLDDPAPREIYSEAIIPKEDFYLSPVHSLRDGQYAYYLSARPELYDLAADPEERKDLATERPDLAALYRDRLESLLGQSDLQSTDHIDQETIDMLRSLGYVADGGAAPTSAGDMLSRPAPRDSQVVYRQLQALREFEETYPFKMIEGLSALIEKHPNQTILQRDLGRLLVFAGKPTGIDHLRRASELEPDDPRLHTFLGLGYHQFARFDEAIAEYRLALSINPQHAIARYNLGLGLMAKDEVAAARQEFLTVVEQNPEDALALNNLAHIAFTFDNDPVKAREWIERAFKANPENPLIQANRARYAQD